MNPIIKPVSAYLHIPFCRKLCSYCDFTTYDKIDALIPDYSHALAREIELVAKSSKKAAPLPVHSVYFGGGTPSLLPIHFMRRIFTSLRHSFDIIPDAEITIEANPGTLDLPYLNALHVLGVNRLSIGAQFAFISRCSQGSSSIPSCWVQQPEPRPYLRTAYAKNAPLEKHPSQMSGAATRTSLALCPYTRTWHPAARAGAKGSATITQFRFGSRDVRMGIRNAYPSRFHPVRNIQLVAQLWRLRLPTQFAVLAKPAIPRVWGGRSWVVQWVPLLKHTLPTDIH